MNLRQYISALALFVCAFAAQAHSFVTERAWVEDPTGQMTLAEAKRAPATAIDNKYFTRGFSQSTFWLRLHIDPQTSIEHLATDKLVIRIRPPYQDQVDLYDPLADKDRIRQTGDYFDWMHDEYRSLNLNFVIPVGQAPRDVWLRLRTNQSTMTVVEVMTEDETRAVDRQQEIATTLYLVVLLVCMGWGSLNYFNQRDRLIGSYIMREVFAIAYALVMLGYFRMFTSGWLPVHLLDPVSNIIIWFFVAYVIWFDAQLILEFKPHPWLIKVLLALPWVLPVNLLLLAFGNLGLASIVNSYVVIVAIFLILCAALSTRAWAETKNAPPDQKPVFSKAFLVSVYATVFLVVLINRLPIMGFVSAQDGFLYLNLVYAVLSSVAMMVLIQVRTQRLNARQQESQRRLEFAELEAAQERGQRVEQSNFLKMLAHEMKTPLSVVRMAVGSAKLPPATNSIVDRAITDMNSVIERLLEVERLQDRQISLIRTDFDLVALLHKTIAALPGGEERIKSLAPPVLLMSNDMRLVQVVLSNLLDNALKYSPPDAQVQVKVVADNEAVHISVENPIGTAGVPDSARVFDKYYRAPRAYERTGSGLGLYLVQTLVAMMGGQVAYSSNDNKVYFSVSLPVGVQESF